MTSDWVPLNNVVPFYEHGSTIFSLTNETFNVRASNPVPHSALWVWPTNPGLCSQVQGAAAASPALHGTRL